MTGWTALARELDAWGASGAPATLWWRDDDAVADTAALRRLIATTQTVPLALAVIPASADDSLVHCIGAAERIAVLQHGWRHANHAAAGAKKAEFSAGRDRGIALQELRQGRQRLDEMFGQRASPVLVPPWNRIDRGLVDRLPEIGITGLSVHGPRRAFAASRGMCIVNSHVDIVNWRDGRRFLGTETCLALLVRHLGDRREGREDRSETTGVLTHHLIHDAEAWDFMAALLEATVRHPAVQWLDIRRLLEA